MKTVLDADPTTPALRAGPTWPALDRARQKSRELAFEARCLARLGQTWPERLSVLRFAAKQYLARLMPFDTRHWESTIQVRGAKYVVGVGTSEVFTFDEIYEVRQYSRDPEYVPATGWTVFDVGANVGVFTVQQAQQGADVYSFEPNPDAYSRLSRNVTLNGFAERVHLFESALGDEAGTGTMHVIGGGTTGGFVVPSTEHTPAAGSVVTIVTLDDVVPSLDVSRIDLLKIDAEGAEIAVLRGAERTLDLVQRIVLEYHSRDLRRGVEEILARHGFSSERTVDYWPEDETVGWEEVGLLYARRLVPRA